MASILLAQDEKPELAERLASRARDGLASANLGPRPFRVASPSGVDYTFLIDAAPRGCLLRLYGRAKGFWSYSNNLTYIETRELPKCTCSE